MPQAWVLVYVHPPRTSRSKMDRLHHQLFGYTDRSNHGRYAYERKGLLSGLRFLHLRRGVLVLPLKVGEAARLLVEAEKARVWMRRVDLTAEDERKLDRGERDPGSSRAPRGRAKRAPKERRERR